MLRTSLPFVCLLAATVSTTPAAAQVRRHKPEFSHQQTRVLERRARRGRL